MRESVHIFKECCVVVVGLDAVRGYKYTHQQPKPYHLFKVTARTVSVYNLYQFFPAGMLEFSISKVGGEYTEQMPDPEKRLFQLENVWFSIDPGNYAEAYGIGEEGIRRHKDGGIYCTAERDEGTSFGIWGSYRGDIRTEDVSLFLKLLAINFKMY